MQRTLSDAEDGDEGEHGDGRRLGHQPRVGRHGYPTMHGPFRLLVVAVVALVAACATATTGGIDRLEHIVVIYAENRSFDHLYGFFPGAEGIAQATPEQRTQLDHDGRPLPHLPPSPQHWPPKNAAAT